MNGTEAATIWDAMTGMQKLNVLISIGALENEVKERTIEERADMVSVYKFSECMYNLQEKIINHFSKMKKV